MARHNFKSRGEREESAAHENLRRILSPLRGVLYSSYMRRSSGSCREWRRVGDEGATGAGRDGCPAPPTLSVAAASRGRGIRGGGWGFRFLLPACPAVSVSPNCSSESFRIQSFSPNLAVCIFGETGSMLKRCMIHLLGQSRRQHQFEVKMVAVWNRHSFQRLSGKLSTSTTVSMYMTVK